MTRRWIHVCLCVAGLAMAGALRAAGAAPDTDAPADSAAAERLFAVHVYPLIKAKCLACHGDDAKKIKGGFDMRTRTGLLKGGETGKSALAPGNAKKSPLFTAVTWSDENLQMPPKENDRLTDAQVAMLRQWIDAGAPWPSDARREALRKQALAEGDDRGGVRFKTSGGQAGEWTDRVYEEANLWAFRPVVKPDVPRVQNAAHPIDAFVRRKLAEVKLAPALPADRRTLIRRATFDLTGLPPTPAEVRAFVNDDTPDAWAKVIDRLLASPHYGERWGQHWLDVTRYADTSGFSNDWERSNAWRYRDYVVRAFNRDKPYDQFIREQIAGDELPEKSPDDPEMLIAIGFLRMGPWEHTAMSPESVTRQQYLDDVTNAIGQTFLSTALRCAKCHDHKFDPVPTRDYYRVYSALATTQPVERPTPFLKVENRNRFQAGRERLKQRLAWAQQDVAAIKAKEEQAGRAWAKERGIPYVPRTYNNNDVPEERKPPRHIGLDFYDQGFLKVRQQDVRIWTRRLERYQPIAQSVYSAGFVRQNSMRMRIPDKPNQKKQAQTLPVSYVYTGGDVYAKGDPVTPGVLSALPNTPASAGSDDPWALPAEMTGRRLALADWIADPRNPLTTRSIVNRVWQYHFGVGLATNPNNFGATGGKPTHPQLLDWLAATFVERGWSIKKLHRLIMTSAIYRQASQHGDMATAARLDPNNQWLSYFRPRRLTAEELRDSMLAASGELNREVGGLPVFPEINIEVALAPRMLQFSLAPAYQPSPTPAERNRRSLYTYRCRGLTDPMSDVFNKPPPAESCERRDASTVTPQVFTLMNSQAVTDRSIAMAQRLERERPNLPARINLGFMLAVGRHPTQNERQALAKYVTEMAAYHRQHKPETTKPPLRVKRSVVEEMSGLAFDYTERLDVYEGYVPHAKAWTVSAETRALADLCMVLFNANEFIYVY